MPGGPRHDRQHRHRVEQAVLAAAPIWCRSCPCRCRRCRAIGEEQAIELALLQHARGVLVPLRLEEVVVALRVAPHAVVMAGWPGLQERHEVHPPFACSSSRHARHLVKRSAGWDHGSSTILGTARHCSPPCHREDTPGQAIGKLRLRPSIVAGAGGVNCTAHTALHEPGMRIDLGNGEAGHGADAPMQVFSSGSVDLRAVALACEAPGAERREGWIWTRDSAVHRLVYVKAGRAGTGASAELARR